MAGVVTMAVFGGLAYWVSIDGDGMAYLAAFFFAIMALLGGPVVFVWFAIPDKEDGVTSTPNTKGSKNLDPTTAATSVMIGMSDTIADDADD